jgi:hypothetical protein
MEKEVQEQYEYARKRIKQKKTLYFHFVIFLTGSLFLFLSNRFLIENAPYQWPNWVIAVWCFLFILHLIKVYITDRFMNENWEREQINKLMDLQQKKTGELNAKINKDNTL